MDHMEMGMFRSVKNRTLNGIATPTIMPIVLPEKTDQNGLQLELQQNIAARRAHGFAEVDLRECVRSP